MRPLRICFVITEDWYFWSHRRSLAQFLLAQGHEVHLVTRLSVHQNDIAAARIHVHEVGMRRSGRNPWKELQVIRRMANTFRTIRPDLVHLVGMKPIVHGSLAARVAGVPGTICAIAGLGWLFTPGGILKTSARQAVSSYFRVALAGRSGVRFIVQNEHHHQVLTARGMARPEQLSTIAGAGVSIAKFPVKPEPGGPIKVLTHARMLWDKGIGDLVAASEILRSRDEPIEFHLVGDPDAANPASIPPSQLDAWHQAGLVQWHGRRDDIPRRLADCHIACLPSYHEGFPLSVVEAMACGRPVVTTDIPGCRDAVTHEQTGLLVPPKAPEQLAEAISRLAQDAGMRRRLGMAARRDVEHSMSSEIVNGQTLDAYFDALDLSHESSKVRRAA